MSLSTDATKRLLVATASKDAGNEVASAINNGAALAALMTYGAQNLIVATGTSQTTDFGDLEVGDTILHVPASAGNAEFLTCQDAAASGSVAYNGGTVTGAQTVVVDGHTVSFTAVTHDASGTVAAALAAIALVSAVTDLVTASESPSGTLLLTANDTGAAGNAITLAVTGTGATRSGATFTGGLEAGMLPAAAVQGDLYIQLREVTLPAASAVRL